MIDEAALQAVIDKQAITEGIYAYCRAVDRLDIALGHSIWHDDAYADYGESYYQGPGKAVIDLICGQHAGLLSHSHQVANILITLAKDGDGDRAGSEAYVTGTMRLMRDGQLTHLGVWGRYLDIWERREGRWGIVRRTVLFDHEEVRPVVTLGRPIDFRRDRSDPSYQFIGDLTP